MIEKISEYIENKKLEMLDLIQTLVNIDSGSSFKAGVDRVGHIPIGCPGKGRLFY